GVGENFLGNFVFSPGTNYDTISVDLGQNLPLNTILTATITGVWGNTSEFSEQYLVTDPPVFPAPPVGTETCLGAFDGEIEISAPGAYYFSIDGGTTVS